MTRPEKPFQGDIKPQHPEITPEMWLEMDRILQESENIPGRETFVLRRCQEITGYLPSELLDYLARRLNRPSCDIFGIASFYSLFSFNPKGRNIIRVCTGTACHVKGVRRILDRLRQVYFLQEGETTPDRSLSLESVRCLGTCGLAPVMLVNQTTYGHLTPEHTLKILQEYQDPGSRRRS